MLRHLFLLLIALLASCVSAWAQGCPAGSSMGQSGICVPDIGPGMQAGAADLMVQVGQMWPWMLGIFLAVIVAPSALRALWDNFIGKK